MYLQTNYIANLKEWTKFEKKRKENFTNLNVSTCCITKISKKKKKSKRINV